jgi:hypothetical protein
MGAGTATMGPEVKADQLCVGDKVELLSCSSGAPGVVKAIRRGRLEVEFSDMPGARWWLSPESLKVVKRHLAEQPRTTNRKELAS